jgi:hypothetical protein
MVPAITKAAQDPGHVMARAGELLIIQNDHWQCNDHLAKNHQAKVKATPSFGTVNKVVVIKKAPQLIHPPGNDRRSITRAMK